MNFSGHFLPDLSPPVKSGFRVVVFVERGSPQPWRVGSRPNAQPAIPPKPFAPAILSRMRLGVLKHLGIAQAPACPPGCAFSSSILRRPSRSARSSIRGQARAC